MLYNLYSFEKGGMMALRIHKLEIWHSYYRGEMQVLCKGQELLRMV